MRVSFKLGETKYSVLSVWPGRFPGSYSVSRDKPSEKYPAISIIDVLKKFAAGEGFVNISVESEREQRGQRRDAQPVDPGDFGDSEGYPF